MTPRRRPQHCVIFRFNIAAHVYDFDLRTIHWHHWGAPTAEASARSVYLGMGHFISWPVTLLAQRRRRACGHNAYTRVRIIYRDGTHYTLRPPGCRARLKTPG